MCVCVQYNLMEKRSLRLCVTFLEQIAKQTSGVMLEICAEQRNLNDQVESESVSSFRKLIIQQNSVLTELISKNNQASLSCNAFNWRQ